STALPRLAGAHHPFRIDDRFRRRIAGVALSTHQACRANDRRETRHWRIAWRAISERVVVQTDFPRSVGHQAQDVTAVAIAPRNDEARMSNAELSPKFCERENYIPGTAPFRYRVSTVNLNASIHHPGNSTQQRQ